MAEKFCKYRLWHVWLAAMLLLGSTLSFLALQANAQGGAQLVISPVQGSVGETVDVTVSVTSSGEGIAAYGMQIDYDKDVLEAVSVTPSYGNASATGCLSDEEGCFQSGINAASGWVRAAWLDMSGGDHPLSFDQELFVIRFLIKSEIVSGSHPISVDDSDPEKLSMSDGSGNEIQVQPPEEEPSSTKLASLSTSTGSLSPAFREDRYSYSQNVANDVTETRVTAVTYDAEATLTIDGNPATSGDASQPIDLNEGDNDIVVVVTAANGDTQTYIITVRRAAEQQVPVPVLLSGLQLSEGRLSPSFAPDRFTYAATVGHEVERVKVTPATDDPNAIVTVNGEAVASGAESQSIALDVGRNTIDVTVTNDQGASQTYTIRVTRAAEPQPPEQEDRPALAGLELSEGSLRPSFAMDQYSYSAEVPYETEQVTVTPAASDEKHRVTVNGEEVASGTASQPIELDVGKNKIAVKVENEKGENQTYTISVTRAEEEEVESSAALADLEISSGRLSPRFASDRYKYTAEVKYGVKQIRITPTAEDETATIAVNNKQVDSGEESGSIRLSVGKNSIKVKVTAEDGTSKTYVITVTREEDESDSSDDHESSHDKSDRESSQGSQTSGQQSQLAAEASTTQNGEVTTVLTVNEAELNKLLRQLDQGATLKLAASAPTDNLAGVLNGAMIKELERKNISLELSTGSVVYTLPVNQLQMDQVFEMLGEQVDPKDVNIQIQIAKASRETAALLESAAQQSGYRIVQAPLSFQIAWEYKGKRGEISSFPEYVKRKVLLPGGADSQRATTAVRVNGDGTTTHVPTRFFVEAGKTYAEIASLTNSAYALVWHPRTFADIQNHEAKADIEDMASRLVIAGVDAEHFAPQRSITRAEMAAILVKALGLEKREAAAGFTDVTSQDWFYDAVATASQYKLISGYTDGSFLPGKTITRAEAMVMVARAMKIAGLETAMNEQEISSALASFPGEWQIPDWARTSMAAMASQGIGRANLASAAPDSLFTRADAAVWIRSVLQKAGLIE